MLGATPLAVEPGTGGAGFAVAEDPDRGTGAPTQRASPKGL
jgi:hypothetical protein